MALRGRRRLERQAGRHALVDGIPFALPVASKRSPVLMAAFPCDAERVAALLPGNELHPFRLWSQGVLLVTVIDYRDTVIGRYVEYSIAVACTHGRRRAPRLLPALLQKTYGLGQYVVDLPVSSEVSVKGGKGIWGMPKHQANLDFIIGAERVASQYDLDGQLCAYIEVEKKSRTTWPLKMGAANYCAFRGMLMKSYVYFTGKVGMRLMGGADARLVVGDHPRMRWLKELGVAEKPMFSAFFSESAGLLDDYMECWFLTGESMPAQIGEGMDSVVALSRSEEWLPPPSAPVPGITKPVSIEGGAPSPGGGS